jgi:hypothetical protein
MNNKLQYRILRVIEYVGDRDWIDEQIAKRGVKGSFVLPNKRGLIREAILGDVAELWPIVEDSLKEDANVR